MRALCKRTVGLRSLSLQPWKTGRFSPIHVSSLAAASCGLNMWTPPPRIPHKLCIVLRQGVALCVKPQSLLGTFPWTQALSTQEWWESQCHWSLSQVFIAGLFGFQAPSVSRSSWPNHGEVTGAVTCPSGAQPPTRLRAEQYFVGEPGLYLRPLTSGFVGPAHPTTY